VLDLGCGTGSLALLAAEAGHRVIGVDLSSRMIERARAKLAATPVATALVVGDAAAPPIGDRTLDAVVVRHLVWALPDPHAALRRWVALLRPGGRLVLVEGRWTTSSGTAPCAQDVPWDGGVTAATLGAALAPLVAGQRVERLSDPVLWGRPVHDERYAIVAHL
jgi:ubiquinone/menaquinone biosynthesis C-methylase UbiE